MFIIYFLLFLNCYVSASKQYYDTFHGTPITLEELKQHDKSNNTFWCTIEVEECKPRGARSLDGTCNNLKHVTRGATHTPFYRVLPAVYGPDFEPRKAKDGSDLELARKVRTTLLGEGRVPDQTFTQLLTYYWVFMSSDVVALHDTVNYIEWTPYCCTPKGKTDRVCTPNKVPDDDPVFRFSDIRCLNMTRPFSFQSSGCIKNNTTPQRINTATPLMDLSNVYGSVLNISLQLGRKFEGGLLKFDEENGQIWPPSAKVGVCRSNQPPHETRCHATPDEGTNTVAGINLMAILFWRQHNRIANVLATLNPCWDDERLFTTARDINIAISIQIYVYEMLPSVMGLSRMIRDAIVTPALGFRDFYDPNLIPQTSLEYPYVLRWVHKAQEGRVKMYDHRGHYLKQIPVVNLTLRTGYFSVDNNMDYILQGSFRQPAGKLVDNIVDPDLTGIGLGPHQRASDVLTNDLAKGRYFGFPPYVKYVEFCSGRTYRSFEDLIHVIDPEVIEQLKDVYKHVEDIDLIAGLWSERPLQGGYVPPTFYCLVIDQLRRNIASDRHWYERPNRPKAFNFAQLQEIRKATMARLLCSNGHKIMQIQPNAFVRSGPGNDLRSCQHIPAINLAPWRDTACASPVFHFEHGPLDFNQYSL